MPLSALLKKAISGDEKAIIEVTGKICIKKSLDINDFAHLRDTPSPNQHHLFLLALCYQHDMYGQGKEQLGVDIMKTLASRRYPYAVSQLAVSGDEMDIDKASEAMLLGCPFGMLYICGKHYEQSGDVMAMLQPYVTLSTDYKQKIIEMFKLDEPENAKQYAEFITAAYKIQNRNAVVALYEAVVGSQSFTILHKHYLNTLMMQQVILNKLTSPDEAKPSKLDNVEKNHKQLLIQGIALFFKHIPDCSRSEKNTVLREISRCDVAGLQVQQRIESIRNVK